MVCSFVRALNWTRLHVVLALYRDRLDFGVKPQLVPLLSVPGVTAQRARLLYMHGFRTPAALAAADPAALGRALQAFAQQDRSTHRGAVSHLEATAARIAAGIIQGAHELLTGAAGMRGTGGMGKGDGRAGGSGGAAAGAGSDSEGADADAGMDEF
jgi:hypothetical protein